MHLSHRARPLVEIATKGAIRYPDEDGLVVPYDHPGDGLAITT